MAHWRWACASASHDFAQVGLSGEHDYIERLWCVGDNPPKPKKPQHVSIAHKTVTVQSLEGGCYAIDFGDDPPLDDGTVLAMFLRAAYFGDERTVETFIAVGNVDINQASTSSHCNALGYAAGAGHLSIVKKLLDAGAKVSESNPESARMSLAGLCEPREFHEVADLIRRCNLRSGGDFLGRFPLAS